MEKIENMFDSLSESIDQSIKDFSQCKDLNQKKTQAEIIKLLCESLGVFFNAMKNSAPYPFDDFYEDDYDDDYDEEDDDEDVEEYELEKRRKIKNNKKSNKDSIPF
jgi:hypothetical protein